MSKGGPVDKITESIDKLRASVAEVAEEVQAVEDELASDRVDGEHEAIKNSLRLAFGYLGHSIAHLEHANNRAERVKGYLAALAENGDEDKDG